MLSLSAIDWILVFLVPAVAFILGIGRAFQPKDYVDYCLARRALGTARFLAVFFGANVVFTAIFLVLSFETARRGWWAVSIPVAFFLGTVLLAVLYRKLVPYLDAGQTLHQALGAAFDQGRTGWSSIRRWAAIWTIAAFVGLVAIEFYGGILLFQWASVPLLANITIAIILATVCAVFTIVGGLRGVARVDIWLDVYTGIGILVFLVYLANGLANGPHPGGSGNPPIPPLSSPGLPENIIFALAAFALFLPMPICALDSWQRAVAWKEREKVTGVLLGGATSVVLVAGVAIMAGFYARNHGWAVGGAVPLQFVLSSLQLPPSRWDW